MPPAARDASTLSRARATTAALSRRDDLGHGYFVLHFTVELPIEGQAGHFAMLRAERWGHAPLLPRPMSLLTSGAEPTILIKVVGEGTARMAQAPLGERFSILAPLGTPWRSLGDDSAPILVAGGVGVPPVLFLARELARPSAVAPGPRPQTIALYGGRTARDLPLADELARVADLRISTEDGSRGTQGVVTDLLAAAVDERLAAGQRPALCACGPHGMMAAVAKIAATRDVPCQVSLESLMGCGYGVCLGCPTPRTGGGYLYTCTEGPCVDAREVAWEETAS